MLQAKYEAKLESSIGRQGVQDKNPPMGRVWIFSGDACNIIDDDCYLFFLPCTVEPSKRCQLSSR